MSGEKAQYIEQLSRVPVTELPLAAATKLAYGVPITDQTILTAHFSSPGDGELTEPAVTDIALESTMAFAALQPGEYAIGPCMPPWYKEYAEEIGLHAKGAHIIEIPYYLHGAIVYPYPDPLYQATSLGIDLPQSAHYITPFPHREAKGYAEQAGINALQQFDPVKVGDKSRLRDFMANNGYPNIPYHLIRSEDDIQIVINMLRSQSSPEAWLKLMRSSGGEGVKRIQGINNLSDDEIRSAILQARNGFRDVTKSVYGCNGAQSDLEAYWPGSSFAPSDGLLVECDASVAGISDMTPQSNSMIVCHDGRIIELARFKQLIHNGAFLGSIYEHEVGEELNPDSQLARVGTYAYQNNVRGVIGIDYFEYGAQIIEANIRAPFSEWGRQAMLNVITPHRHEGFSINDLVFAQSVMTLPRELRSLEDIRDYLGDALYVPGQGEAALRAGTCIPWRIASADNVDGEPLYLPEVGILSVADNEETVAQLLEYSKSISVGKH